jgi:hypothetical protein
MKPVALPLRKTVPFDAIVFDGSDGTGRAKARR